MADNMQPFFEALASRAYKENDLSDVTYALCESNPVFKQFFFDFLFGVGVIDACNAKIEREHAFAQGRPDFLISTPDGIYLIEAKIWDGNHHFAQYEAILDKEDKGPTHLAYITNYTIKREDLPDEDDKSAFDLCQQNVKTWKSFVKQLEKYNYFENELVRSYVSYVKKVCPFDGFDANTGIVINVEKFRTVKDLLSNIRTAIGGDEGKGVEGLSLYTRSSKYFASGDYMGSFFEWDYCRKTVWGWYGVYHKTKDSVICIEFENREGWGNLVCDRYKDKLPFEDGSLRFYFNKDNRDQGTIKDFLESVLTAIQNGSLPTNDFIYRYDDLDAKYKYEDLFVMKAFPLSLEKFFFTIDLHEYGYEIASEYKSDQDVPESHCGQYFRLTKIEKEHKDEHPRDSIIGWIGTIYKNKPEGEPPSQERNFTDTPAFVLELNRDWTNAQIERKKRDGKSMKYTEWYDDGWGWKCYDIIPENNTFGEFLKKVKDIFGDLLS